ncbi:exopolysaccharide biosynthesis protein [Sphingomonas sp. IC-11]|uniref:exopolysaccharide biosynthesis protein n=1 Tax=Sphingomonas sp. IC-11 TaxID=2898528 RepID=UPI001E64A0DB|nr:exopolysaccharide biosynthesis protein [Sphingomonas sp. IC-11]MCD2314543.1 exopolysaccharide biosynthesis protein [Sphingomonas sp. IC-11]
MPFPDLLRGIVQRWRLMLAIIVGTAVLAAVWIALTPRSYVASASLLIDSKVPDPVGSTGDQPSKAGTALATEAKIVASAPIAARVAAMIGQLNDPAVRQAWMEATGGVQSLRGWAAKRLLAGLEVVTNSTDNLLVIRYTSSDAARAAQIANAFAAAYTAERLAMSTDPARTYASWFERRIGEARRKLEASQTALSEFQRKRGIISTGSIDAESTRLGELSSQLSTAEAQAADARARASVGGANLAEVQQSAVIQGLRSQIATKSAQIQEMSSELGANHPNMRAANAELAELRAKLGSETGKTSSALGAAQAASNSREAQIRGLLAQQRARMLALADDRSTLEVLESDAASARREYDAVMQQLASMRLRSTLPATNVRELDRAEPPLLPSSPDIAIRFLLSLLFGLLLAVGVAAALEFRRPRVRSVGALRALSGAPVLGVARIGAKPPLLPGAQTA